MNEFSYSWWETNTQDSSDTSDKLPETTEISEQPKEQEVIIINPGDDDNIRLVPRLP